MSEAKVIFDFEQSILTIQCNQEDKMRNICQRFSTKVGININLLIFLYGGNQLNLELKFKEQANSNDKSSKEMKVLVIKNENDSFTCPNCGEKIKLNSEKLDEIISSNNSINDNINGIKFMLDNVIKISTINTVTIQLKNINVLLNNIIEDIKKNNEKLMNLLNETNNIDNTIKNNLGFPNKNIIKGAFYINKNDNNIILFNTTHTDIKDGIDVYIDNKRINMTNDNNIWKINNEFEKNRKYIFQIVFNKNITNIKAFFNECSNIVSLDLSNFNTANVTFMGWMFNKCHKLKEIKGINKFITNKVTNMNSMFQECYELEDLDLSNFDTINVTDMSWMFNKCNKLKEIKGISKFVTNKVSNMGAMFQNCFKLEYLDLSNFNTSNVTYMGKMFNHCHKLKEIKGINKFVTNKVTNMNSMFQNCHELEYLDLSNFNTTNVSDMEGMFCNCDKLKKLNVSNFTISGKTENMFNFKNKERCEFTSSNKDLLKLYSSN